MARRREIDDAQTAMRERAVEMKLDADESSAAEDDVMFVGGAPLLL